jgi:hypothetical protein
MVAFSSESMVGTWLIMIIMVHKLNHMGLFVCMALLDQYHGFGQAPV